MSEPVFFPSRLTLTAAEIAQRLDAPPPARGGDRPIAGVAALDRAEPDEATFCEGPRNRAALAATRAGLCLVRESEIALVPEGTVPIAVRAPAQAFARLAFLFHPDAERPGSDFGIKTVSPGAHVHPAAKLEAGVVVDPGAVVGPGAAIGSGTVIGAGAVIGPGVRIGRDCSIGPTAVVRYAFLGDRVILHPGVKIGQDGFGFVLGPGGHAKVAQIGRVVVQNDVEIGAGSTIDRGALVDTIIGEGTKIDNQVQIAHNVRIGRHCVLAAFVGVSGSCTLGDFVVIGGGAGIADHVAVGQGAQIAAAAAVMGDVPAGARWAGYPAENARDVFRQVAAVRRLARRAKEE
jgi:UDP-3-O-[3-hydroxymyristoyl] glucosamine N-acyltransferase